ncbi:MAG: radical SAM protein [Eubacteriales bacterium]
MKEALFYERVGQYCHCYLCPHHCKLKDGGVGRCNVRKVIGNKLYSLNYGEISSICIDPIEKKPIARWMQGSDILSIGSFGCNFHCDFCQNHELSMEKPQTIPMRPDEIVLKTLENNIPSIGYTYNEPTIFYEMMLDVSKLARAKGLNNVMVTNGFIEEAPLRNILHYLDAVNIDLKTYDDMHYHKLGGSTVDKILDNIKIAADNCHVEVTLLIVPGLSDSIEKLDILFKKLAVINRGLTLHISRYFPRYHYDQPATDINLMLDIQKKALQYFQHVYVGNVR